MSTPSATTSFLWDRSIPEVKLRSALADPRDPDHDRLLALLLREARPDEVWSWTTPEHVADHLDRLAPRLGRRRLFWEWLFDGWRQLGLVA